MADLPTVVVNPPKPEDYAQSQDYWDAYYRWLASVYAAQYQNFQPGPPNYVETPLPEVVVEADAVDWEDLSDAELVAIGTDDALGFLEQRSERNTKRTVGTPTQTFAPPIGLLYPAVGTLTTLVASVIGGIGALFVPTPTAPREIDEAPTPPRRPPGTPLPPFDDPMPPNWEDLARPEFDFPKPDEFAQELDDAIHNWYDVFKLPALLTGIEWTLKPTRIGDPGIGRILPIGDNPGLLFDTPSLPEFPLPQLKPRPSPVPSPSWPSPFPFGDPIPILFDDPTRITLPEPYFPPYADPNTWFDPLIDAPPRIADPIAPPRIGDPVDVAPPRIDVPPGIYPNPFDEPIAPGEPLGDPFDAFMDQPQPQGDCNCNAVKNRKKKKKKKPKARTVCYEGHYEEHAHGLTKKRGKEIPCAQGKASKPRAPRPGRAPTLPGLARDIFGLPT